MAAGGQLAELTATEWKLLTNLAATPGRVFSRYELVNRIRGYEFDGYERTIDSHIRNLRHKIETDPHAPQLIQTVTGVGYRLAATRDRELRPAEDVVGRARRHPPEDRPGDVGAGVA